MRSVLLIVVSMALMFLGGAAAAQSGVEVVAQVQPQSTFLGSPIEYIVSVQATGRHDIETPEIELPPGLRLLASSTSFESRQGPVRQPDGTFQLQMTLSRSFIYTLAADRIGEIIIPPATVVVDGQEIASEAVNVTVREPAPMDGFSLDARLSKSRVYAGEPFTLYLTWFVSRNVQEFALVGAELPDFVSAEPISPPSADRDRSGRYPATAIYGERIYGTRGEATVDGARVLTVAFEIRYRCSEPGRLDLGPISMIFDAVEGGTLTRGVARTESIPVEILPLPVASRPAGFGGLIGSYTVEADAVPTAVNVGDPITLTVRIAGPDARLIADGPDLSMQSTFAGRFKFDPGGWERRAGSFTDAVFETRIRALSTDIAEIPSVEVPYFDTSAGAYRVAASAPIPLEVRPSRVVTLEDAVVSSALVPPMAREALGTPRAGLWAIAPAQVRMVPAVESADWWWWAALFPPLLWGGLMARDAWRARARGPASVHRRVYRRAMSFARRGQGEAAVRTYMADLLGQVPETVTAADCRRAIADPERAAKVCAWLAADEAARFGRVDAAAPDPAEVVDLIRSFHHARVRARGGERK